MPEKGYTYSEQLVLEFVKSQYGAPVLGILTLLLTTVGTAGILFFLGWDKFRSGLSPDEGDLADKLTDIQRLGLILLPAAPFLTIPLFLQSDTGQSLLEKARDLNVGNRFFRYLGGD